VRPDRLGACMLSPVLPLQSARKGTACRGDAKGSSLVGVFSERSYRPISTFVAATSDEVGRRNPAVYSKNLRIDRVEPHGAEKVLAQEPDL
jgi:hypothetical protein